MDLLEQNCLPLLDCNYLWTIDFFPIQAIMFGDLSVTTAYRHGRCSAYLPTAHRRVHLYMLMVSWLCLRGFSAWGWAGLCVGRPGRPGSYCPRSGWAKTPAALSLSGTILRHSLWNLSEDPWWDWAPNGHLYSSTSAFLAFYSSLTFPVPHPVSWEYLQKQATIPNPCLGVCFFLGGGYLN